MDKLFGEGNREAVCVGTGEAPRLDWRELCLPILLHLQHLRSTFWDTFLGHFFGALFGTLFGTLCLQILLHFGTFFGTHLLDTFLGHFFENTFIGTLFWDTFLGHCFWMLCLPILLQHPKTQPRIN